MGRTRFTHTWKNVAGPALALFLVFASACSDTVTGPARDSSDVSDLVVSPSYALIGGGAWSATGPGTVTLGSDGSSGDPSMKYSLHGWSGTWSLRSTATQSGPVAVSYNYTGFHSWCGATVFIRAFLTRGANTTSTQLAYYQDNCSYQYPSGGFNENGAFTFNLQPGDVFGFEFGGSHFDSNYYLEGKFTITQPIVDSDGDGVPDNQDAFPSDPSEWQDTDGDGHGDNGDAFPSDPSEWQDTDGDGHGDNGDAFPSDPSEWQDTDGDGHGDNGDAFPSDPSEWQDTDGDGVGDNADAFDNSNLGATVIIRGCNTGVANHLFPNGATFNDLIGAALASSTNHGQFVSAVTGLADGWKKAGLISGREQGLITSCAARSK